MERSLGEVLGGKPQALYSVAPQATVSEAVQVMVDGGVGCVLVLEHGRIRGLFTERDLMCRVVATGREPGGTALADVMTTDIATVTPRMTVGEAMTLCTQKRLRHLPVFDGDTLLGVVSIGDLTKAAVEAQAHTIDDLINYISGNPA